MLNSATSPVCALLNANPHPTGYPNQRKNGFSNIPDGVPSSFPKHIKVYDNGGKTADRYTATIHDKEWNTPGSKYVQSIGFSENADSPQGVSQFSEALDGPHLGKQIHMTDLPGHLQQHLIRRLTDN